MGLVYREIYKVSAAPLWLTPWLPSSGLMPPHCWQANAPTFRVHVDPSLTTESIVTLFDSDLMAAPDASRIMRSNLGIPLSSEAASARDDRRKAANVLPFRDKVSAAFSKATQTPLKRHPNAPLMWRADAPLELDGYRSALKPDSFKSDTRPAR